MNIVSLEFVIFSILFVAICSIIPSKWRWIGMLVFSIYFYIGAGVGALVVLALEAVIVFFMGNIIEKTPIDSKRRRYILGLAISLIIGYLILAKSFAIIDLSSQFIIMPLGISYVTFSLVGYLVDIYWEKDKAEKNILKFFLFVFFFPKITQGPIEKHADLAPQLHNGGVCSYENVCFGMQRMLYGYFKKTVIADRIALFTEPVFLNLSEYAGSIIIMATILGALRLYCDFSGYMDIVLGLAECFGIRMAENFKHPFFSKSAAEFWRRWHITLGAWFKDYVYTPVVMSSSVKKLGKWGRKKVGKRFGNTLMKVIALGIVWFFTGLWHGTGINYVLWGLYWGGIIIFSTIFEEEILKLTNFMKINTDAPSWKVFQMIRTFCIFAFGYFITRMQNINELKYTAYNIVSNFSLSAVLDKSIYSMGLGEADFHILKVSLLILLIISIMQEKQSVRKYIASMNAPIRWIIYAVSISVVLFIGIYGSEYSTAGFEYTQF